MSRVYAFVCERCDDAVSPDEETHTTFMELREKKLCKACNEGFNMYGMIKYATRTYGCFLSDIEVAFYGCARANIAHFRKLLKEIYEEAKKLEKEYSEFYAKVNEK